MSQAFSRRTDSQRSERVLFIVLVVVSYIITFSGGADPFTPLSIGIMIAAGVVYLIVGLACGQVCERLNTAPAFALYFAVQITLGSTILYLSEMRAWLLMLPLAGIAVDWLPRRWMLIVCGLILVAMVMPGAIYTGIIAGNSLLSSDFWIDVIQLTLAFAAALGFVVLFMQVAVREREARAEVERLAAELRAANRQLREYAAQAEELATLKERTRLAREIHDGLGHYLTAINMQIQAGRAVLEHHRETALDALDKAQALAQEGLAEVRRSVAALRASPLDTRPLPEAIEELVDECRAAGIATEYAVRGEVRALDPQVELTLYRAAQEGMTNMRKHAQASSAEVTLVYPETAGDEAVRLTVRDYGVGTDDPTGGFGLIGVRERVSLLGGEARVETAPGEGFTLQVDVPG